MKSHLKDTSETSSFLKMDDESFERLSTFVTREYGIELPFAKKTILESRLNGKVKELNLKTYKEFLDFIFSDEGKSGELYNVTDLITTNSTDFFREASHFHFLVNEHLPLLCKNGCRNLKLWSAGCSTGEEPYSTWHSNTAVNDIGPHNVSIALEVLREYNIKVPMQCVGGRYNSNIVFNTSTGNVRMRLLINSQNLDQTNNKVL
jgi:hypothetical protein